MALITLCSGTARTSRVGCIVALDCRLEPGEGESLCAVTATVDTAALAALRPRGGVQRLGLRVYLGVSSMVAATEDARVDQHLIGGWRFSRSLNRTIQEGSLSTRVTRTNAPWGSQISTPAPVPAGGGGTSSELSVVWVELAYHYGMGQEVRFPLMRAAISDSNDRTDAGTVSDSLALRDAGAYLATTPVTLQLPAGHGLTYGQVIRKLYERPGGSSYAVPAIPGDFPFRKEVNIVRGEWLTLAAELADLWGMQLFWNEAGFFSGALHAPESQRGPVLGIIDERDILRRVNGSIETISITPMPEAWTHLCLQGTTQITRPGGNGRQSLELPSSSYAFFAPAAAPYLTLSPTGYGAGSAPIPTAADLLRSEGLTVLDIDGETVVGITTISRGWRNLSAARYQIVDAALALTQVGGVWVSEQTDGALAYAYPSERFGDVSASFEASEFDAATDRFRRKSAETWGYHHARRAIQTRGSQTDSWDNSTGISGTYTLGNGEGVVETVAAWGRLTRDVVEEDASTDGYRTYRLTVHWEWTRRDGWRYRYGDGSESDDAAELFLPVTTTEERWLTVPGREDIHVYQRQVFDRDGKLVEQENETRRGGLEAIETRNDLTPSRDSFDSDAEWRLAVAASRYDVQPMLVKFNDAAMLRYRPRRETTLTVDFAQYPWQLVRMAQRLFLRGRARVVSFSVPPNPLFRIGTWWRVRYRRAGMDVDHDGIIMDSTIEQRGAGGPKVQRLAVVVY